MIHPTIFNPGLAAARLLYHLSGTNELKPIQFYSPSVSRFSDDGLTISGSSYGYRIFGGSGKDQFAECVTLIKTRSFTKRAAISIYSSGDAGRASRDIPCALAMVFLPRKKLDVAVIMRANDALKLMPYNLFEFSALAECMAAATGLELGEYHQFTVSIHLRAQGIDIARNLSLEVLPHSDEMSRMTSFGIDTRLKLTRFEAGIRDQSIKAADVDRLGADLDEVWQDVLYVTALEAERIIGTTIGDLRSACLTRLKEKRNAPLSKSYATYLERSRPQS